MVDFIVSTSQESLPPLQPRHHTVKAGYRAVKNLGTVLVNATSSPSSSSSQMTSEEWSEYAYVGLHRLFGNPSAEFCQPEGVRVQCGKSQGFFNGTLVLSLSYHLCLLSQTKLRVTSGSASPSGSGRLTKNLPLKPNISFASLNSTSCPSSNVSCSPPLLITASTYHALLQFS